MKKKDDLVFIKKTEVFKIVANRV